MEIFDIVGDTGGKGLAMSVLHDGKQISLGKITPEDDRIGIRMATADAPVVARTLADSPAAAFDLPGGSRLVSVNGKPVATWADVQRARISGKACEGANA